MYVLSAVRTPIGLLNGSLYEFSIGQLGAIILREALERAVVPVDDIEHLFMGCALESDFDKEVIRRTGLPKTTRVIKCKCSLESFVHSCEFLTQYNKKLCMAGGVESMSNNFSFKEQNSLETVIKNQPKNDLIQIFKYISSQSEPTKIQTQSYINDHASYKNDAFSDELAKITFKKKGCQIIVTEDEQIKGRNICQKDKTSENLLIPGDGAAASVIVSEGYVKKNLLTPLVKVISFASECTPNMFQTIGKALDIAGFGSENISMWEINALDQRILTLGINHFNINASLVNKDGGMFSLGYPIGMYGIKMISHVVHSLPPGEFGCVAGFSINGTASAVILEKLCSKTSTKPQLTLYTKKECPLCDDLEKQLEPYKDRFSLQKIDIESDGNEVFENLYRYEIPVLFLDGTFLCKHRLDLEHFNRRLRQSEETSFFSHKIS